MARLSQKRILELVLDELSYAWQRFKRYYAYRDRAWQYYWGDYGSERPESSIASDNSSSLLRNFVNIVIRNMELAIWQARWRGHRLAGVKYISDQPEKADMATKLLNAALDWVLFQQNNFLSLVRPILEQWQLEGETSVLVYYDVEKKPLSISPTAEALGAAGAAPEFGEDVLIKLAPLDGYDLIPDWTGQNRWIARIIRLPLAEVRRLAEKVGIWNDNLAAKLQPGQAPAIPQLSANARFADFEQNFLRQDDLVSVIEIFGTLYSRTTGDLLVDGYGAFVSDEWLRPPGKSPFPVPIPIARAVQNRTTKSARGYSIWWNHLDDFFSVKILSDKLEDSALLQAMGVWVLDQNAAGPWWLGPLQLSEIEPGQVIPLETQGRAVGDVFRNAFATETHPAAQAMLQYRIQNIQRTFPIQILSGMGLQRTTSATETATLQQNAQLGISHIVLEFEQELWQQLIPIILNFAAEVLPPFESIAFANAYGEDLQNFALRLGRDGFRQLVNEPWTIHYGGITEMLIAQQSEDAVNSRLLANLPVIMQFIQQLGGDPRAFIEDVLFKMGLNPRKYLGTERANQLQQAVAAGSPEQVQQVLAQAAQQGQAGLPPTIANLGGVLAGGG